MELGLGLLEVSSVAKLLGPPAGVSSGPLGPRLPSLLVRHLFPHTYSTSSYLGHAT
jgi:hypothetical protein